MASSEIIKVAIKSKEHLVCSQNELFSSDPISAKGETNDANVRILEEFHFVVISAAAFKIRNILGAAQCFMGLNGLAILGQKAKCKNSG